MARYVLMGETAAERGPRTWTNRAVVATALLGLVIGGYSAYSQLRLYDWDPAGMIAVGVADPDRIEYAERIFEREIPLRGALGHDGRFFIIQAMDPLFLDVESHARYLDRPTYRSQRMLFPTLASLARPFAGAEGVAWAMAGLNVLAFGLGAAATAVVARHFGASAIWGLAFPLNPGVVFEMHIGGGGALALAALMIGIALLLKRRMWAALVALTAAVLAREVMLIAIAGLLFAREVGSVKRRLAVVLVPLAGAAVWWSYVQLRLSDLPEESVVQAVIGLPLQGFTTALDRWLEDPGLDLVIGVFYLFVSVVMVLRAWRRRSILEMPALGFATLAFLLAQGVWQNYFDISRALTPLPTFLALSLAASIFGRRRDPISGEAVGVADPESGLPVDR